MQEGSQIMKPTLNIIGAGKVGQVLAQQFQRHHIFAIQDILNRSIGSAQNACAFIGAGTAVDLITDMRAADLYMITVADDQISTCSELLRQHHLLLPSTIVFHCSGALNSGELGISHGAASLHPMRSFADPARVAAEFAGTICSLEGDATAVRVLTHALHQIEAEVLPIKTESKTLYHAAGVFTSNYLVTLMDTALQTFEAAGISPEMARKMAQPMAQETLNNIFRIGPQRALTGPIARGDQKTVARHQQALAAWDPAMADLYNQLASATQNMKQRS
jgi:predicted short-subunit dehydrogenase-like oxidoreductase (DUF2520 family)